MLDAILLPIGEGNRILAQISDGKIDELIAQTYKGDHEKMKLAVNNVATVLQTLQKELARLTDAAAETASSPSAASRSSSRAPMPKSCAASTSFSTRSSLPSTSPQSTSSRSARATFLRQITDTYNGDFNLIKNNLNTLIAAMNDITAAAEEIVERQPHRDAPRALAAGQADAGARGHGQRPHPDRL